VSRADVTLVSLYPGPGQLHAGRSGVASYTANLARSLTDAGASVTVVAPVEPGVPDIHHDGRVRVERHFRRGVGALPAAAIAAEATDAPVVHLQHELFLYGGISSAPGLGPALGRLRFARRSAVVTLHHVVDPVTVDDEFVRLFGVKLPPRLVRTVAGGVWSLLPQLAPAVVVHEPGFVQAVKGSTLIPHGIEPARRADRDAARRRLGLDPRTFVVLCFGYLAPYKGIDVALEAAALTAGDVSVIVAGGPHPRLGPDYERGLRRRYAGVATFTGHVPEEELSATFAAADAALLPYPRPFSSSGALALALAHGTPVLVSCPLAACVGARASLAVPSDPAALAGRLRTIASDPRLLEQIRQASAELAHGRGWSDVAQRHIDLYEEVSDGARPAGRRVRAGQPG